MAFSPKSLGADEVIALFFIGYKLLNDWHDWQDPFPQHWGILHGLDFRMCDAVQLAMLRAYDRARGTQSPLTYLCSGPINILHPCRPHPPHFIS
jgi:hypothetical protein